MQLIWQKGELNWIASRSERPIQLDQNFPIVAPPTNAAVGTFAEQLLNHGGDAVVILFVDEPTCNVFAEYGRIASYNSLHLELGESEESHANCTKLWRARQKAFCLNTGYGLSDDKLWRRHSWLISQEQALLETTELKLAYFGVKLSEKQAAAFSALYLDI